MANDPIPPRPMELVLDVQQGSTFQLQLQLADDAGPLALAGYSAQLTMRAGLSASIATAVWSTATGEITLDTALGYLNLNVDSVKTAAFVVTNAAADLVFDLVLFDAAVPAFKQTLAIGTVRVWRAVTRSP